MTIIKAFAPKSELGALFAWCFWATPHKIYSLCLQKAGFTYIYCVAKNTVVLYFKYIKIKELVELLIK